MIEINKKIGQIKMQEMAFVLVAFMVFFVLVGLLFVKFRVSSLQDSAETTREEAASNLVKVLAATPELSWASCTGCIDLDKALFLKNEERAKEYEKFWKLDYLVIKRLYPEQENAECDTVSYPKCDLLKIIEKESYGSSSRAFVTLCRQDLQESRVVCELGEIYASGENQ